MLDQSYFEFDIAATDEGTDARAGSYLTPHGPVQTPVFMPVGTAATVKSLSVPELRDDAQAQIVLGNTYHLYLRPGLEVLRGAGGLHGFSQWEGPMLTDSGGYQVFSLSGTRKIKEEGVVFSSHIDGSKHMFSPESTIDIQRVIGADIIMVLDECTPFPCDYHYAKKSMYLTDRWMKRCMAHFANTEAIYGYPQLLVPIVQGSTYEDLRIESANMITDAGAKINAIGGLSVGEPEDIMYAMTECVTEHLPTDKPRYLMGVGTPWNLLNCIARGIDMFDCVLPSRNARHGQLYTYEGAINIKNAKWKSDHSAIDPESTSPLSRNHSKAYLRHLIHSHELLGARIATLHNICFYQDLMRRARQMIIDGKFHQWFKTMDTQLRVRL